MRLPNDPNAKLAMDSLCQMLYGEYKTASPETRKKIQNWVKADRIKHFMEQSEARVCEQNGKFVCEEGFVFQNVVEECESYRIYRCDGGHHYAVVYIEHKERDGGNEIEIKYIIKNGQLVPALETERHADRLELE